ncbi:uncharacterized protein LOC106753442 [Vigna radiata var. radiata]|uniref:Uncharacterized protein LOC106753442 n=1 Tax=Vigna radiata var. radiata TaxID=3916 RepID=A0A1S3TAD9_VIGRR|nr:uncharacterized protein LOC106753442 [Vigna radiata var. radiata]
MEGLLSQFRKVFADLVGLPPDYSMVHHIPLKEGIDLVNVRPYRYPHVMKREIEQQVVEMLKTGGMDLEKVKVVLEWSRPKTVRGLRGFLGLTGYYRRFVRDYGESSQAPERVIEEGRIHMK